MGNEHKLSPAKKKKAKKKQKGARQVAFVKFEMPSNSGKYVPWCNEATMDSLITDHQQEKLRLFIEENAGNVPLKAAEYFADCVEKTLKEVFPGMKESFGKTNRNYYNNDTMHNGSQPNR